MSKRTYVLVPQPATAEELGEWVQTWAQVLPDGIIAPELLDPKAASVPPLVELGDTAAVAAAAAAAAAAGTTPPRLAEAGLGVTAVDVGDHHSTSSSGGTVTPSGDPFSVDAAVGGGGVLMRGFLLKMPMRSQGRTSIFSASSLLGDLASWKRRYFVLRHGLLQWYRDDPDSEGEFLGVIRLTPETAIEYERGEDRVRIRAGGESLLLREDSQGARTATKQLPQWQQCLAKHVSELAAPTLGAAATLQMDTS